MIKKIDTYVCLYCAKVFPTKEEAEDCLNEHPIVFTVNTPKYSHDCWGSRECDYTDSGKVFKTYKKACKYAKENDGKVDYRELS